MRITDHETEASMQTTRPTCVAALLCRSVPGPCIDKLLAEGVCKLDSMTIMGPAAEIEKTKPGTKDWGTVYYDVHSGFNKYKLGAK